MTGVYADYHYIGTGDNGGATDEETVKMLEAIVTQGKIALPSGFDGTCRGNGYRRTGACRATDRCG